MDGSLYQPPVHQYLTFDSGTHERLRVASCRGLRRTIILSALWFHAYGLFVFKERVVLFETRLQLEKKLPQPQTWCNCILVLTLLMGKALRAKSCQESSALDFSRCFSALPKQVRQTDQGRGGGGRERIQDPGRAVRKCFNMDFVAKIRARLVSGRGIIRHLKGLHQVQALGLSEVSHHRPAGTCLKGIPLSALLLGTRKRIQGNLAVPQSGHCACEIETALSPRKVLWCISAHLSTTKVPCQSAKWTTLFRVLAICLLIWNLSTGLPR